MSRRSYGPDGLSQVKASVRAFRQCRPVTPQRPNRPPGYTAMWVGISLEFLEFAVFFAVYFIARFSHPEDFRTGAPRLWTTGGLLITLAMVSSGYALTRAIAAVRSGRAAAARAWHGTALAVALCYPLLKFLEIERNTTHGLVAGTDVFVPVYYYLTINHLIHASWGILGMIWIGARLCFGAYTADDARGLEALATYWHATDIVWLMIFALFYAFA